MFSSQAHLAKKTGQDGVGRYDFLKLLSEEFQKSTVYDGKLQVLANLANFAYDPINFEHIRKLHILDLFLDQLSQENEDFLNFGLAGICNLSSDPENRAYIIRLNGVFLISNLILHSNEEIALNAITTLIFLISPETQSLITKPEIINKISRYQSSANKRFQNLSNIFLQEYCTPEQLTCAKTL